MNIQFSIISKENITDDNRKVFSELLKKQGKVKGDFLKKADRCKMICIALVDDVPVAIGGIKKKTKLDFQKEKANIPDFGKDFNWEIGYLYTDKEFTGLGIGGFIVNILIKKNGTENLMASTEITQNPAMVNILVKKGFVQYGKPWKSGIHSEYLGLYLKYQ